MGFERQKRHFSPDFHAAGCDLSNCVALFFSIYMSLIRKSQ